MKVKYPTPYGVLFYCLKVGSESMAKYRKKPVVIEAFRMGIDIQPDWFTEKVLSHEIFINFGNPHTDKPFCDIRTLEGVMRGNYGDFIILGVNGECYPCKPDIFEKTYERVDE